MANQNSFWMDTMLPSLGAGAVSTLSNLAIMAAQNKFNAEQAQIARDWNLEQDNTKYQRAVVDMQRAGVNPALMMSKGPISTQAATNVAAQGATPAYMNMSAVASLAQTISQAKLNYAQKRQLDTQSDLNEVQARYYGNLGDKITQETIGLTIDNKYREEYNQLRNEGQRLANSYTGEQLKKVGEEINNLKADTGKKIEEAKTEQEKQNLYAQDAILKQVQAYQIVALIPYHQNVMSSQGDFNRSAAKYQLVQAAYQQGLIDEGMIEALVRQTNANASKSEIDAIIQETKHALGIEKAEVKNIKSDTFKNYTHAATEIVNTLANVVNTVVGAATGTPASIPSSAFIMQ